MDITLTDSLMLLVVLAVLLIGFGNRRAATAQASRGFVKDHLKGLNHRKHDKTLLAIKQRLHLLSSMLTFTALGVLFAFAAATLVIFETEDIAKIAFIASLASGAIATLQAVRESSIANRSHFAELDSTISAYDPHHGPSA